ncbi:uncharacterized protein LOC143452461 [Clavelina lepadiformis]|uniref:Profilin n=1 Tax=Clavelina lepadiformis TaxID=159417 RepID=A0ABP0GJE6_CLALP
MDWNLFCCEVLTKGSPSSEYVYLGTTDGTKLGENDRRCGFSRKFTTSDISIIINSNGSDFFHADGEYIYLGKEGDFFCHDGETRSMVYGFSSKCILIVCGSGFITKRVFTDCRQAVEYGIGVLKAKGW